MRVHEPAPHRLELAGFFGLITAGWTNDQAADAFYHLARHLPGFGGLASYDALTDAEVLRLLGKLRVDLEREAAALRKRGKR